MQEIQEKQHKNVRFYRALPGDPFFCLQFEEKMLKMASSGERCVFVYQWEKPCVVLGRAQGEEDVDRVFCEQVGIPVLRRITGGTGVIHNGDIAVSVALPAAHEWATSITGFYRNFLEVLRAVLAQLGIETEICAKPFPGRGERSAICFENVALESLLFGGKKAVGCAQARRSQACLVHGLILRRVDAGLYARVFRSTRRKVEACMRALPMFDVAEFERLVVEFLASVI